MAKKATSQAKLIAIAGPIEGRTIDLVPGGGWPLSVGRAKGDIPIADGAVSRRHAEVSFRDGQWILQDMSSANGTFVNGRRIDRPVQLRHEDKIRIGTTILQFIFPESWNPPEPESPKVSPWVTKPQVSPDDTVAGLDISNLETGAERISQEIELTERIAQAGRHAINLSHGIKNILQAVIGGREAVDEALASENIPQARKAWAILGRNLDLIQKLVIDMLKFVREDNPTLVKTNFNSVVRTAVETLKLGTRRQKKKITLQTDAKIPPARLDPDQIYDVVLNLALNAIFAVPAETGVVKLETHYDAAAKNILLKIIDNGPGIPDTKIIFEPFHTTKEKAGIGLGLSIARKIVLQHKGSIEVQSQPGQGATFIVTLPAESPENS
jgi:signal transduction histidine kinase